MTPPFCGRKPVVLEGSGALPVLLVSIVSIEFSIVEAVAGSGTRLSVEDSLNKTCRSWGAKVDKTMRDVYGKEKSRERRKTLWFSKRRIMDGSS